MSKKEEEEEDSNKLEDVDAVPLEDDLEPTDEDKLERNGSIVQRFKRSVSKRLSTRASLKKHKELLADTDEAARAAADAAETADDDARKKKQKEDDDALPKVNLSRLFYENRTEWPFIIVGIVASIFMGAIMPIFAILFGQILGVISYEDEQKARDESGFYAVMFFLLGLGSCTAQFLQGFMFAISGEILTARMRRKAFSAMVKQVGRE